MRKEKQKIADPKLIDVSVADGKTQLVARQIEKMQSERNAKLEKSRMLKRAVVQAIFTVVCLIILPIVVFIGIMVASPKSFPSLFGNAIYIVASESMEPKYYKGNAIVVKSALTNEITKGTNITFRKNDGSTVTHQVVEVLMLSDNTYYRTWGINNIGKDGEKEYDEELVEFDDVIGIATRKIPALGETVSFLRTPWGVAMFVAIVLIFFSGMGLFIWYSNRLKGYKSNSM